MRFWNLLCASLLFAPCMLRAQQAMPAEAVTAAITLHDDSLSSSFSAHNEQGLMSLFASDVEFFHDTQGLQDYAAVRAGFHGLFASGSDIRRERLGALEVYPMRGYGAIEVGTHRFCHTEHGRQDCGTFKFVQIWRHDDSGWKITRVVSYGH